MDLPPHPRDLNQQRPADGDLAWLTMKCLHRDPARRPSAAVLVERLHAFRQGKTVRPRETWGQWRPRILGWFAGEMREPDYVGRWKWAMRIEAVTCPLAHVGAFLLLTSAAPGSTRRSCTPP